MEITCPNCKTSGNKPTVIVKSYGSTLKIRSRSIRWDGTLEKTVAQCNYCRSFVVIPVSFSIEKSDITNEKFFIEPDKKLFIIEK